MNMKKILVFLFVLTLFHSLFAQKENEKSRFSIGISYSPNYCFRTINNTDTSSIFQTIESIRNDDEKFKLGHSAGVSIGYNFSEHWALNTGVFYSDKGYETKKNELFFGSQIDPRNGFSFDTSNLPTHVIFREHFLYMDIPLSMQYKLRKEKFHFSISAGIIGNFFITDKRTTVFLYEDGSKSRDDYSITDVKSFFNLSPKISIGAEYFLNDKQSIRFEPSFQYGLIDIFDYAIQTWIWNAGVKITYFRHFNKKD